MLEIIDQNHFLAFIVSALAASMAVWIGYLNYKRTHDNAAVIAIQPLLEKVRSGGIFDDARAIVHAARSRSMLVVLDDVAIRDKAGRVLAELSYTARIVRSTDAWHSALRGSEYADVLAFLRVVTPLVWIIRTTPLDLEGDALFYNGNKHEAAEEIYAAIKTPLYGVRQPRSWRFSSSADVASATAGALGSDGGRARARHPARRR
jgi:hypothetical protein